MRWFRRTQEGMKKTDTPTPMHGPEVQVLIGKGRVTPPRITGPRPPVRKFVFPRSPLQELLEDRGA